MIRIMNLENQKTKKFFYTFGSDPDYPYAETEYVEVHARSMQEADEKFMAVIPNRKGSTCLNCAFVYSEKQWIKGNIQSRYYCDKQPIKIIE